MSAATLENRGGAVSRSNMSVAAENRGGVRALVILRRCVRAPFRVLVRARDLYVSRMAACAGEGRGPVGMVVAPRSQSRGFYRSAAAEDAVDIRELIRAATRVGPSGGVAPRSRSVGVARIDEDRPCEFGLDAAALGRRSRSCAVGCTARTSRPPS